MDLSLPTPIAASPYSVCAIVRPYPPLTTYVDLAPIRRSMAS